MIHKLKDAVEQLYEKAVTNNARTSTSRLNILAEFCVEYLKENGLPSAEIDVDIQGGGRVKNWDVAWKYDNKYRLAISLKSILHNLAGTVPNRIDNLIGEVTNVQMYSPEIVVGYIMIFDVSKDRYSKKHKSTWCDLMKNRLENVSGRSAPAWGTGMVEAVVLVKVDFFSEPKLLSNEEEVYKALDLLIHETKIRNPSLTTGLK